MNSDYGFKEEVDTRYPESGLWESFNALFELFPLAIVLSQHFVCLHGGIGPSVGSVHHIRKIPFPLAAYGDNNIVSQIVWSDPSDEVEAFVQSARGKGSIFGGTALKQFLNASKCKKLLRAHQCTMYGYEPFAFGQGLTIFNLKLRGEREPSRNYLRGWLWNGRHNRIRTDRRRASKT